MGLPSGSLPNGAVGIPFAAHRAQVPLPEMPEKSPFRIAVVGTVSVKLYWLCSRYSSYAKKKKILSLPLYIFGMLIGPPRVPPKSLRRFFGRYFPTPDGLVVNGSAAFKSSLTHSS